jgi:hypothetical protein
MVVKANRLYQRLASGEDHYIALTNKILILQ